MSDTTVPAKKSVLSNAQYDALKWLALIGLPAVGALYFGLAELWNLPKPHEVVGTLTLLDTFLGVLLGVAKKQYMNSDAPYDGTMEVLKSDSRLIHQLEIATSPDQLSQQNSITLKVVQVDDPVA
jgi:hypothetical protein